MPIVFNCTCGKKLQAKEELAGKRLKCPGCHKVVSVPAQTVSAVSEELPLARPVLARAGASGLPPLPEIPAFPDEDDMATAPPAARLVSLWTDRSLDQQSTPWQENDREHLNQGMKFREVPDFLYVFLALVVIAGLIVAAIDFSPGSTGQSAVDKSRTGADKAKELKPWQPGSVEGRITYKGVPLNPGVIVFHSDIEELFPLKVQADGSYRFVNMYPGKYQVSLNSYRLQDQPAGGKGQPKDPPLAKFMPIPQKYMSPATSGLAIEVKSGKQTYNISLTD